MKSAKLLKEFTEYCQAHPDLRFWQALACWSGIPFIAACNYPPHGRGQCDTFYWEGKNK